MLFDILSLVFFMTAFAAVWAFGFFVFDAEILDGYFKKKLQRRFNKDEIK